MCIIKKAMILLVTTSARAQECAQAIQQVTTEPVQVASTLRQAAENLREQSYVAIILDQSMVEAEPDECDVVLQHTSAAALLQINFAISGIERLIRELRVALNRRKREAAAARREAEQVLRSELKGTITALLLSCEMALGTPNLPSTAEGKLRAVYDLAREIRTKIGLMQ
jgi:hypothetical protein